MAENKVNLDTLISYYIHRPLIQGKGYESLPPLYGRIGAESESSFDKDGIQNPIWQERGGGGGGGGGWGEGREVGEWSLVWD